MKYLKRTNMKVAVLIIPILMYPFISYYMHCGNIFTGTIKSNNNIGIIGDDMGIKLIIMGKIFEKNNRYSGAGGQKVRGESEVV